MKKSKISPMPNLPGHEHKESEGSTAESLRTATRGPERLAGLAHQINNATMSIKGNCEIMRQLLDTNNHQALLDRMPSSIEAMDRSVTKITLAVDELSRISSLNNIEDINHPPASEKDREIKQNLSPESKKQKSLR